MATGGQIPDSGVHEAGRYRSRGPQGSLGSKDQEQDAARNFGPGRVSFGYDPAKPHARHMNAKDMNGRHGMVGVLTENRSSALGVQQFRCAVVRNRNAQCARCAQACTSGCIQLVDNQLVVDAEKCVGCGTCATVCPTCALESRSPTDAELLERCLAVVDAAHANVQDSQTVVTVPSAGQVVIVCHPLAQALDGLLDGRDVVEVVCLGRVDESLAVGLAAHGVQKLHLLCGDCMQCDQKLGLDCAHMVAQSANCLLETWGSAARVSVGGSVPDWVLRPAVEPDLVDQRIQEYFKHRRGNSPVRLSEDELTSVLSDYSSESSGVYDSLGVQVPSTADSAQERFPKVMKDGTLPHFVPARRERLLDALVQLGSPCSQAISTRLWGQVVINPDTCISCRMCATFCPTGAIVKYGDQDSDDFGVEHYPGDCVKCNTCCDICPQDAITIYDQVPASCLIDGQMHRFAMLPRAVRLNDEHQIVNTVRSFIDGDIFER